uniref:Uncharacterized protein n=1 Tax=Heterorhabditis bacteriophora TaxID=37862 RepID=A0A1I7XHH2_HETBA
MALNGKWIIDRNTSIPERNVEPRRVTIIFLLTNRTSNLMTNFNHELLLIYGARKKMYVLV